MNDHPQPNGMQPLEPQMLEFRRAGLVKFLDMGMDAWWYDKNWFEIIDGPVTGLDREVWGQYLYWNITRAARPAARPMLMSMRSEHPASHRYPIWWTGDIPSTHAALREGIRDSVNDGVGRLMPYVSQDLGGHLDQPSEELYVRFLQYGCFSPITRVHGTRKDGLFRDPWRFGAEAAAIIRDYVKLRYRLMPVIYAAARRAYDEGFPILRPLTLEWPAFSEARTEDEYLFGDDLLVAPIHTAAENGDRPAARSLWIPPGEWEDLWTGAIIAGPRTIQVSAPLRQMPLYARRGGVVMLAPEMSYTGERPWDPVTLEIFPPDAGSVTRELYEDDGHSQEYQAAGWARTPVRVEAGASNVTIRILPTAGRFAGQLERRAWRARVRLKSGQVVRNVRLDGRNLDAGQDYAVLARKPSQMDPIPLRGWGQLPSPQAGVVVEIETQAAIHEARTIEVDL